MKVKGYSIKVTETATALNANVPAGTKQEWILVKGGYCRTIGTLVCYDELFKSKAGVKRALRKLTQHNVDYPYWDKSYEILEYISERR